NTYKAFHLANPGGDMNRESTIWTDIHDRFDIQNPRVYENIYEDQLKLKDLLQLSADVDPISKEWSDYYELTLTKVFPYLDSLVNNLEDIEEGIVRTFVWLLSVQPDGLIMKKVGIQKAIEIQKLAATIIQEGKLDSESDQILSQLDDILRSDGNQLNPGTTADFISAAILCKLFAMKYP
ncbi:MAG: triphosphoribosyl-dephospho-CoA synthase, partial [Candidatus Thorarchaeota archaeon]